MNYEKLLADLQRGRALFERAEAEWFLKLRETEVSYMPVIQPVHGDFTTFLRNEGLCDPSRYESFCEGLSRTTPDNASKLGVNMVIALCRVQEPKNVKPIVQAALDDIHMRNGLHPSRQKARDIVTAIEPKAYTPKATRQRIAMQALHDEVQRLSKELKKKESEIATLKKLVATLRKASAKQDSARPG